MRRLYLPLSRRTFVRLSAYGGAAAAFGVGCTPTSNGGDAGPDAYANSDAFMGDAYVPRRTEEVGNLIIGSGFGGSISAYRLGEAGHTSVVLERGRRWTITDPTADTFSDMGLGEFDNRSSWLSRSQPLPGLPQTPRFEPYTGVLEKVFGDGINIVCAAAVGGGSVVYSGMMVQPPREFFEEIFPSEISYDDMDTIFYPRARSMMGTPTQMPADLLARTEWTATRTFLEQADHAGFTRGGTGRQRSDLLYCAFDWDLARREADGEFPAQLTRGSYIFGINSGAKGTLDKYYLGMAEAAGWADVRPLHWVQRIVQVATGWRVEVDVIDTSGVVQERVDFMATRLIVSAGTANTNTLLLRAKAEGTIEGLPDALGEGFGNNGQHIVARNMVGVDTGAYQAGPACAMMFDLDQRIAMENGPAPLGFESQTLISTGQGIPTTRGRLVWDATMGRMVPTWDPSIDAQSATATANLIATLNTANGGAVSNIVGDESITFHPLGGCVHGEVTDMFGRVNGVPNLYVVDGSLIPGATPLSNPFWTVSANAERCIERIIAEDFT
jgi:cholesterol oxidase